MLKKLTLCETWTALTGDEQFVMLRTRRLSEAGVLPSGIGHVMEPSDVATFLIGLAGHDLHSQAAEGTRRLSGLQCATTASDNPSCGLEGMTLRDALATALQPPYSVTRLEISHTHNAAVLGVSLAGAETVLSFESAAGCEPRGLRKTITFPANVVNQLAHLGSLTRQNDEAPDPARSRAVIMVTAEASQKGASKPLQANASCVHLQHAFALSAAATGLTSWSPPDAQAAP